MVDKHELEQMKDTVIDVETERYEQGLIRMAKIVRNDPKLRQKIDLYVSGEIHNDPGAGLESSDESGQIFSNDHGVFVGTDGEVFNLRTDAWGGACVYASLSSEEDDEPTGLFCFQRKAYDGFRSQDNTVMRFDFVNSLYRRPPSNSLLEQELQCEEGLDYASPRHLEGAGFDSRRDSILLVHGTDDSLRATLHNSEKGTVEEIFDCRLIQSLVERMDAAESIDSSGPTVAL